GVREVLKVKRPQHGVIPDPMTIGPDQPLTEAADAMREARIGTLVVIDRDHRLAGLLTARDLRFVDALDANVASRMTPVERLVTRRGTPSVEEAAHLMAAHKVKKLPLVDEGGRRPGLMTALDIPHQHRHPS